MEMSLVLDHGCMRSLGNTTSQSAPNLTFPHFDLETHLAPQPSALFGTPTRRPSGASKHWKNSVSRLFYLLAQFDLLSPLFLSLSLSPSLSLSLSPPSSLNLPKTVAASV